MFDGLVCQQGTKEERIVCSLREESRLGRKVSAKQGWEAKEITTLVVCYSSDALGQGGRGCEVGQMCEVGDSRDEWEKENTFFLSRAAAV